MNDLPDAPWIREAEMYGLPEEPAPVCPCCGQECDTYYYTYEKGIRGDVVGCENCIRAGDAYNE